MMDMGCKQYYNHECPGCAEVEQNATGYPLAMVRYVTSANPTEILSADVELLPNPKDEATRRSIDVGTSATLAFPSDVTAFIACHERWQGWGPFGLLPRIPDLTFKAVCEGGTIELFNYVGPHLYHSITIMPAGKNGKPGKKRVEKAYKFPDGLGEDWWST